MILMQSKMGGSCSSHDQRLPPKLFYSELQQGKRSHVGQKKRFKDTIKKISLKAFGINLDTFKQSAEDRAKRRSSIHKGSTTCEANRAAAAEQRGQARQARASDPLPDVPAIPCPYCQRTFPAWIGLVGHLRNHSQIKPQPPLND